MSRLANASSAVCPYYRGETTRSLSCEGLEDGTTLQQNFVGAGTKSQYMDSKCRCKHWRDCPIAKLLNEKYDYEVG